MFKKGEEKALILGLPLLFTFMDESKTQGVNCMEKFGSIILIFTILSFLSFGCSTAKKDTLIRCPKCGAYFSTPEGESTFQWMRGR